MLLLLAALGCIKEEWKFNEDFEVDNLDPSFAIPLVEAHLNLGNAEQQIDSENFIYNEEDELFALIYSENTFEFRASDLHELEAQSFEESHALNAGETTAINALPMGASFTIPETLQLIIDTPQGEEIDSVLFKASELTLDFESEIRHDLQMQLTIPGMTHNGQVFSEVVDVTYPGYTPFTASAVFDVEGYMLDLTDNGNTSNTIEVEWEITITSTGQSSSEGDELEMDMSFDISQFEILYGYIGQITEATSVDTQAIDLFRDLNNGVLHFVDPRVELLISNSSGVPANIDFTSVYAPENSVEQTMSGSDLSNFPTIEAAGTPGEVVFTEHAFTNEGTTPDLTSILDEGPFELIYSSGLTTNPDGYQQNFLMDTSAISCKVDLVLPFYGYADNFALKDTMNLDLADELGVGEDDVLSWEDIDRVTIRLIADNGLPIEVAGQVYFADTLNTVIDSLFDDHFETVFSQGFVDFSLDPMDADYGKVTAPTRKITDVIMTREKIGKLIDENSQKVIFSAIGNTNESADGEVVKFYPEYNLDLKISAKIDTDVNLNE